LGYVTGNSRIKPFNINPFILKPAYVYIIQGVKSRDGGDGDSSRN
jgi:hypothetical protein